MCHKPPESPLNSASSPPPRPALSWGNTAHVPSHTPASSLPLGSTNPDPDARGSCTPRLSLEPVSPNTRHIMGPCPQPAPKPVPHLLALGHPVQARMLGIRGLSAHVNPTAPGEWTLTERSAASWLAGSSSHTIAHLPHSKARTRDRAPPRPETRDKKMTLVKGNHHGNQKIEKDTQNSEGTCASCSH